MNKLTSAHPSLYLKAIERVVAASDLSRISAPMPKGKR